MNHDCIDLQEDTSKTGYNPNIQVTTGTYCVTMYSSRTSGQQYFENSSSNK